MDTIPKNTVICQCLNMLNVKEYRSLMDDHRTQKLFAGPAIQLFVESQLQQRRSYEEIAEHLYADDNLKKWIRLDSISPSQLSRKLKQLNTFTLQRIFLTLVSRIQSFTPENPGLKKKVGTLHIVDATEVTMPLIPSKWAFCSKSKCGIKMHTRFVVDSPEMMYPDQIIGSTQDISDHEVAIDLVVDPEATYIMDRGYLKYDLFTKWATEGIRFVTRVKDNSKLTILKNREIPKRAKQIVTDADVQLPDRDTQLRLVEFTDDKGRLYRIVTTRWDLPAKEIAEIYRNRWQIELFFKWIKQHLRIVKVYGYSQEAIWNQLYLALIAYALCLLIKLQQNISRSIWRLLQSLRLYANDSWSKWMNALNRKPSRTSKGRRSKGGRRHQIPKKSQKPRITLR